MPAAMTYDSLLEDLRRYIERGNPSDTEVYTQLPKLIGLCERDIAQKLKILGFINVVTDVMVAGVSVYQKPDRWRETASINIGLPDTAVPPVYNTRKFIHARSYDYCRRYWPTSTERDVPEFYADYDYNHWLIVPTPVAAYPWEAVYWHLPPLLDDTNQTNWVTAYAPGALLYGTLVQAMPFLKNDERKDTWDPMYKEQLSGLDGQDLQRIIDRTTTRQEA